MNFVLALTRHRRFGWVIEPWLVEPFREKLLQLSMRCVNPELLSMIENPDEFHAEVIAVCQAYRDSELFRMFSPRGMVLNTFLNTASDELVKKNIRPFIDKKLNEVLLIAAKRKIPVYLTDDGKMLNPAMRLNFEENFPEPWFCFTKNEEVCRYVLEIELNNQTVNLHEPGTTIVTDIPCWIIYRKKLIRFREGFEGKKINPFLHHDHINIPPSAEKLYFETFILKTLKTGQVRAEGFIIHDLLPDRMMHLSFEIDWQGKPVLITWFLYGNRKIMRGKKQMVYTELKMENGSYAFYRFSRDQEWENKICRKCESMGLKALNESIFVLPENTGIQAVDIYRMVEWLNAHHEEIAAIPVVVSQEGLNFHLGSVSKSVRYTSSTDWFDIYATVKFGELEIPFIQLKDYILDGIREFPLPDGNKAVIPEEWFSRYHDMFAFGTIQSGRIMISHRHFRLVESLEISTNQDEKQQINILAQDKNEKLTIPDNFHGQLRAYQKEGLAWMIYLHKNRFGGILADDMGLGKTIQTLALLLSVHSGSTRASLIVMPTSLIHNWKNEAAKFAPSLRIMSHTGPQRARNAGFFDSVDLVFTTYGILRNDFEILSQYPFEYLILDEGEYIRNPENITSKALYTLSAENRLILSGTPIKNSLIDLWGQMEFLNPGIFGNVTTFKRLYVQNFDPVKDEKKVERLKQLASPFILRRTKSEVEPDLPDLTTEYCYCEMTVQQQKTYDIEKSAVRNEIMAGIESGTIQATSVQVLRALIRMRQTACHPLLVNNQYEGDSGKTEEVIRRLEILKEEKQKVLVFSSFVEHLKILEIIFKENGWGYNMLTGSTVRRQEEIDDFRKNDNHSFFLISMKAGGSGLNLTEAGYIFILDPWWNLATEDQAIARAHRIGQDKKVIAYKFITKDTIEEKILLLQQKKQALADSMIREGNPLKEMSREEVKGLFL